MSETKYRYYGDPTRCAYCGQPADTIDHTVPQSHVKEHERAYRAYIFPKVGACRECNSALSDSIFATFAERKARIASFIEKRYARQLRSQAWSEEELEELGRGLRELFTKGLEIGKWAAARAWYARVVRANNIPDKLFEIRRFDDGGGSKEHSRYAPTLITGEPANQVGA